MTWRTNDIDAEVAALKARGVIFEEYDTPEVRPSTAWQRSGRAEKTGGNLLFREV
jgi:hypothetical protein